MSDTSTLLRLSDNFDTWRDKINKQIDDFITLSEKVTNVINIPGTGSIGLILTNTSNNTPYWEDLKTLLNRLGIDFSTVDELISANLDSLQAITISASQTIVINDLSATTMKEMAAHADTLFETAVGELTIVITPVWSAVDVEAKDGSQVLATTKFNSFRSR